MNKKTALITGASGGIGTAASIRLAQDGFNIIAAFNSNSEAAGHLVYDLRNMGCAAEAIHVNAAKQTDVLNMFERAAEIFGGVDVLVNNAGIAQQKLFGDTSDEDYDTIFDVNVRGTVNCCRAALPYMIHKKHGRIINISSMWGISGASCEALYSASKAAVIGLTKALAKELGPSGITVNCIAPGVIDTKMNAMLGEDALEALRDETPVGRIGNAGDVAGLISYFASEMSDFITGQVICADGGYIV